MSNKKDKAEQSQRDLETLTREQEELREKLDIQERMARLQSEQQPPAPFAE